jgi:outer membrane biosynthesis protein TonB
VPEADVICEWTVLLMSSGKNDFIIDLNENAAKYLVGKPHTLTSNVAKLSGNNPSFPHDARDSGIQGNVKLIAEIDMTGHVGKITEISGPEALRGVSSAAVKTWTYKPLIVESSTVPLRSLITINFAIGH